MCLVYESYPSQVLNGIDRGMFATTVFYPSHSLIRNVFSLWSTTIEDIRDIEGLVFSQTMQRMPAFRKGNSMGMSASDDSLVLYVLSMTWKNANDDVIITRAAKSLIDRIERATKAAAAYKAYKYLNYAASFQDPFSSYGIESRARLQGLSRKYDPARFFQNLIPGGFKIFGGVPAPA